MAHYVLSDIHGYLNRFTSMLERIGFSDQDTLYILGDVIDRGPEGVRLLEQIRQTPNMILLLGNHEYMCLQAHAPEATERDLYRWSRKGCCRYSPARSCGQAYWAPLVEDMGLRCFKGAFYHIHDRYRYSRHSKRENQGMCRPLQYPESQGGPG